jgi:hypothetical protein
MRWLWKRPTEAVKENMALLLTKSEDPASTPRTRYPALPLGSRCLTNSLGLELVRVHCW